MLYVFHVDTGTMLTLDMSLAMESVRRLQEAICQCYHIPEDKQVLLISGGENLDPNARVCSYSAGMDTNPIYLFSKNTIEAATPPSASVNYGSESDLRDQVEGSLGMSATYETVVTRAQLALDIHEVAKEEMRACEKYVHDQHLQHQGWAAVIANLDDITSAFKARASVFKRNLTDYFKMRANSLEMLSSFPETLKLLGKVPLLPCLLPEDEVTRLQASHHQKTQQMDEKETTSEVDEMDKSVTEENIPNNELDEVFTLMDWISAQDNKSSVEQMIQTCQQNLEQVDGDVRDKLLADIETALESTQNVAMKEVRGLEERLYGLEQLLFGARKIEQEQGEMAQGFVQNQNRARGLKDPSVLPDLCQSHRRQLQVMLKNHNNLRDIRRRCTAAKEELSVNLHTRLRWVMYVEERICEVDGRLVIHHETLKKLRRKLGIIKQIYVAPDVYAGAVVEVVRRKKFTDIYLKSASSVADRWSGLHTKEVKKREKFDTKLKNHFLQTLFPGLKDKPPSFANKAPSGFDKNLPAIQPCDIDFLRGKVPELTFNLNLGDEDTSQLSSTTLQCATCSSLLPSDATSSSSLRLARLSSSTSKPSCGDISASIENDLVSDIVVLNQSTEFVIHPDTETGAEARTRKEEMSEVVSSSAADILSSSVGEVVSLSTGEVSDGELGTSVEVVLEEDAEPPMAGTDYCPMVQYSAPSVSSVLPAPPHLQTADSASQTLDSVHSPPRKMERRDNSSHRMTPGTSPEVEDPSVSEAFTTADFYIDESMPSSMTESAPTKKVAELQNLLSEKTRELECSCQEVLELQASLLENSQELEALQTYLRERRWELEKDEKEMDRLRSLIAQHEGEIKETDIKLEKKNCELDSVQKQLVSQKVLEEQLNDIILKLQRTETLLSDEKLSSENRIQILQQDLCKKTEECDNKEDLLCSHKQQLLSMDGELKAANEMLTNLKHKLTEAEEECSLCHDKFENSLEIINQNTLELKQYKDSFLHLKNMLLKNVLQLKCDVLTLEKQMHHDRDELTTIISSSRDSIVVMIKQCNDVQEGLHKTELSELAECHNTAMVQLKRTIEERNEKLHDTQTQLELYRTKLEESGEHMDSTMQMLQDMQREVADAHQATKEIQSQLTLEHEVEIEKIRSDLKQELDTKDQEITSLQSALVDKEEACALVVREKETMLEENNERFQVEKEQIILILKQEFDVKDKDLQKQLKDLREQHEEEVATVQLVKDRSVIEACDKLNKEHEMQVDAVRTELHAKQNQSMQKLKQECCELQVELDSLRTKLAAAAGVKDPGEDYIKLEQHGQIIADIKAAMEDEKLQEVERVKEEMTEKQENEMASLIDKLQKDKRDSLEYMKSSLTADKQVAFNEAVSKLTSEKDKIIDQLQKKEKELLAQLQIKESLSSDVESSIAFTRDQEKETRLIQRHLEDELANSKQRVLELESQLHLPGLMSQSAMPLGQDNSCQSIVPSSTSAMSQSVIPGPDPMLQERVRELEGSLKIREQEMCKLQEKMMTLSMSSTTKAVLHDKVSITSCVVGDVVLLCLDERHDHYVVFTVGTTLHFLHSDCLHVLGLKQGPGTPGQPKKSWVLAEIIDKEYCQAKKASNRFRVPVGTKFYRVKAKPWNREAALQQHQQQREANRDAAAAAAMVTSTMETEDSTKSSSSEAR